MAEVSPDWKRHVARRTATASYPANIGTDGNEGTAPALSEHERALSREGELLAAVMRAWLTNRG